MAGVHKETLLVLDAPAEVVVSNCRRLADQLLYLVTFVHPRQVDEHMRMARAFFFSIDFCSASTSLRFSEAPRKFESQMPPLSSPFTDLFHLQPTL
jgi:hypothetical protein